MNSDEGFAKAARKYAIQRDIPLSVARRVIDGTEWWEIIYEDFLEN